VNYKKFKARLEMIDSGIVPALKGSELKTMFESMNSCEKRLAKRKFRKLWKKILNCKNKQQKDYWSKLVVSKGKPTSVQLMWRATMVSNYYLGKN